MSQVASLLLQNITCCNVSSFANFEYLRIGFCVAKLISFITVSLRSIKIYAEFILCIWFLVIFQVWQEYVSRLRTSELNIDTLVLRWILKLVSFLMIPQNLVWAILIPRSISASPVWFIKSDFITKVSKLFYIFYWSVFKCHYWF